MVVSHSLRTHMLNPLPALAGFLRIAMAQLEKFELTFVDWRRSKFNEGGKDSNALILIERYLGN